MKRLTTTLVGVLLANFAFPQDMPLSQVLIPGEDWELISHQNGFTDAPTADNKGNFYFSDMQSDHGLLKVTPQGEVSHYLKGATGISGMKFGPNGKLYACRAKTHEVVVINPKNDKIKVLANDVRPNDLVITHKGYLYFTETPKKQVTFINTKTGAIKVADKGITGPNGICLSPDQGTLVVSDFKGKHCWAFRIEPDGTLKYKQPYMTMRRKPDPTNRNILPNFQTSCKGDGMITDTYGRYYVSTELGVQYFDPTGRISGVIPGPTGIKGITSVTFAGHKMEQMYITCFDKVYRLKTKTRGILYQDGPQNYPPKLKK
tara:strand:- start:2129 stop:3079 length:951 start_codon:yes stop_codon:yes gene_type:complete